LLRDEYMLAEIRILHQQTKGGLRLTDIERKTLAEIRKVHLLVDNLNTHFRTSFEEVRGFEAAAALLSRMEFHYTPKHASWLNMVEIKIGILARQCFGRRLKDQATIAQEVAAWQQRRNSNRCGILWSFTRQDADRKLGRHYVL